MRYLIFESLQILAQFRRSVIQDLKYGPSQLILREKTSCSTPPFTSLIGTCHQPVDFETRLVDPIVWKLIPHSRRIDEIRRHLGHSG